MEPFFFFLVAFFPQAIKQEISIKLATAVGQFDVTLTLQTFMRFANLFAFCLFGGCGKVRGGGVGVWGGGKIHVFILSV